MMSVYEIFFQTTLLYALNIPYQTDHSNSKPYTLSILVSLTDILAEKYHLPWLDMASFYFAALFFSELYTIHVTVVLASKIYTRQRQSKSYLTVKEILVAFPATKWDSACATAFYIHALSTCILLGSLVLLAGTCYFIAMHSSYGCFLFLLSVTGILVLLKKYLELSAKWNVGIVVSIVEGEYGADARRKSAYYGKGSEGRGFLLMLVFFVWGFGLRFMSMLFGWEGERGIVVQVGMFCVGNLMKWVVCNVYFFDCKARGLEKKSDDNEGRGVIENVDSGDEILEEEGRSLSNWDATKMAYKQEFHSKFFVSY